MSDTIKFISNRWNDTRCDLCQKDLRVNQDITWFNGTRICAHCLKKLAIFIRDNETIIITME